MHLPVETAPTADILIVDDTPDNLRLLSTMLLENGYKVRKAINGERALQAIEAVPPDLILLWSAQTSGTNPKNSGYFCECLG